MLVATLSGLVSEQWFSICGETSVLTFCFLFPGFWDFACMIFYLCCDFCLSSFWFGLNKDRELLHLCAPASTRLWIPDKFYISPSIKGAWTITICSLKLRSVPWTCQIPIKKNLLSSKHKHHHLLSLSTRLCSPAGPSWRDYIDFFINVQHLWHDGSPRCFDFHQCKNLKKKVNWFFTTAWRVLLEKKGTSNQRLEFRSWNNRNIFPTFLSGLLYSWSKWSHNLELERFHSWEMQHRLTHIKACVCAKSLMMKLSTSTRFP